MTKTTHTHRGTCQACGSVQASANSNSLIAKHGYTVESNYFQGTCQGSDKRPAEHDLTYTHKVIDFCHSTALDHDKEIALIKIGRVVPKTFERWNATKVVAHKSSYGTPYTTTGGNDTLPIARATKEERAKAIALAIHEHEGHASQLRSHAKGLTQHVVPRLGKPLYPVSDFAPKAKPAAPTVDVKAGKVVGTFATKAARKDALDSLSRQFDKARNTIQDAYLAMPFSERTKAKDAVYWGPNQLNHWRPRHSMLVLNEFPSLADTVTQIEELVAAREAVKNAP